MIDCGITIDDIKKIAPFSQGTTEIFLTGLWSSRKPVHIDKTSPCRQACPIGNDISRAFYEASMGHYDEALRIYRQDNPLPGVCGRVCYHPCESQCNRKEYDEAVNIRGFERFLADKGKVDIDREKPTRLRKERIAVIGSGPAGLSAAYHLARLGFFVTIFEALPKPGGMLRYGIPEYRLPKNILDSEIGHIQQLGVEIRTGVTAGKDISLAELKNGYQAIFIALGAHRGMQLGIEGGNLPGVIEGIAYLRTINLGKKVKLGKKVAVIGGGNTAIDCARTARRSGAKDITIIYRRSRLEMPALEEDVESVEKEGMKIELLAAPKRLISENGKLSGIECIRMKLGEPDASGRPKPVPLEGSEFIVPVDSVIAAIGQAPQAEWLQEFGISVSKSGVIEASHQTTATSIEGIFAGGDSSGTRAYVADAIASGKKGALAISCYLDGNDFEKEFKTHQIGNQPSFSFQHFLDPEHYPADLKKVVPYDKINVLCFPKGARHNNPDSLTIQEAVKSFKEVVGGIDPARIPLEIYRCFKCGTCTHCDLCFLLCPDISIIKGKDSYMVKTDFCKGCSQCATTCPRNVIEMSEGIIQTPATAGGGK
jgi:NADPH-dependent glutamate synthase beta subunit-like oxidoreductase/Pyruvate/2-oxoacid:ferredoxin oxidoreductase delta subunit